MLAGLAAGAWVGLVAGRGGFWRVAPRLAAPVGAAAAPAVAGAAAPSVVAVVPARDEATLLPVTLPTLLRQRYDGPFAVVVVDDGSTDGTAAVARQVAAAVQGAPMVVVPGRPTPPEWVGKPWAMAQGVEAAETLLGSGPTYLWFTDADIAHGPRVLARLVATATGQSRDVVSVMARLRTTTAAERLVVPAFVYFFGLLYPFRLVGRDDRRTAAAAGGCMLVDAATLRRAGGLAALRSALIDDVALARACRRAGGRLWLGYSGAVRSVRPYPRMANLWAMVSRSAYVQLRRSPALLAVTLLGLVLLHGVPPLSALRGLLGLLRGQRDAATLVCTGAGVTGWAVAGGSYLPIVREYALPARWAATLPAAGLLYGAMTLDSARQHHTGREPIWGAPQVSVRPASDESGVG